MYFLLIRKKRNPEDEAISGDNPASGEIGFKRQSRSSVWLEHYTDNVGVSSSNLLGTTGVEGKELSVIGYRLSVNKITGIRKQATDNRNNIIGGLAQLARAPALHAGGQRFESVILHEFGMKERRRVTPVACHLYPYKRSLTYWKK
jgi:hypothetical protein